MTSGKQDCGAVDFSLLPVENPYNTQSLIAFENPVSS